MKRVYNIRTKTYQYSDNVYVDIKEDLDKNEYSAYIYDIRYAVVIFMFGCPIEQQSYEEFLEIVDANVPDYLKELSRKIWGC